MKNKLTFFLLCLANIAVSFNFAALAAIVPIMSDDLGLPVISVSRILHYYMIPYGLGALLYPPLVRRFNFKTILAGCLLTYAVSNFLCVIFSYLPLILAARILQGLAAASVVPLTLIIIGRFFEKEIRGRSVGLFFSVSFMASLVGIVVSGFVSWRWLFTIPAGLSAVGFVAVCLLSSEIFSQREEGKIDYWSVFNQEEVLKVFVYVFMISFLYHGVHKWLGVYLSQIYGLKQSAVSFYFMLIAIGGAVGQNIGGHLTDKKGRFLSCLIGVLVLAFSTMLLYFKFPLVILGIIFLGFAVGWTIGHNGVSTILTDFPDEKRSEIAGLNSAVRFFSGGLGFFCGGAFVQKNFALTFLGYGLLMLVMAIFLKYIIPQDATAKVAKI